MPSPSADNRPVMPSGSFLVASLIETVSASSIVVLAAASRSDSSVVSASSLVSEEPLHPEISSPVVSRTGSR